MIIQCMKKARLQVAKIVLQTRATTKHLDKELVQAYAKKCGKVITVEENSIIGGLGEAVVAVLAEKMPTSVKRIGVNDEFGHSGPATVLLKQFGLSSKHIILNIDNNRNCYHPPPRDVCP